MTDITEQWHAEMTSAEKRSADTLENWLGERSEVTALERERDALREEVERLRDALEGIKSSTVLSKCQAVALAALSREAKP